MLMAAANKGSTNIAGLLNGKAVLLEGRILENFARQPKRRLHVPIACITY